MGETGTSAVSEAMNKLWMKFLPQIEARVCTLQCAAKSLARDSLSELEQQQASADAHKLAGVLGTFGLHRGTELAREAEGLYSGPLNGDKDTVARLAAIADQLRSMVSSRG